MKAAHTADIYDLNPHPLNVLIGRSRIGPESRDRRGLRAIWRVLGDSCRREARRDY